MPEVIAPPPGYRLEQNNAAGITPPPGYKLEGDQDNPFAGYKPMTAGQTVLAAGKQALGALASPITGLASVPGQLADYARGLVGPHKIEAHTIEGNPLDQAQGNMMAAALTSRGTPDTGPGAPLRQRLADLQPKRTVPPPPPQKATPATSQPTGIVARIADKVARGAASRAFPGGGMAYDAVKGMIQGEQPGAPPVPRRVAPPPQTGSNNRTPLPAPPVTAAPPAIQGSNAPPIPPQAKPVTAGPPPIQGSNAPPLPPSRPQVGAPPLMGSNAPPQSPPRPQVSAPPLQGSNAPPATPRPQASAPPLQGSNNRTPAPTPTAESGPPTPPATTPQAGPPTPPAAAPQAGPPQPPKPQGGAETPPPNTITSGAGRSAYDNAPGKFQTTDEVAQFAKANGVSYEEAVKGFAQAGNKVLDRGGLFREIHDPRYGGVGGHPEIKAQFSKMYPQIQSMSQATPAQLATFLRQVILKQAMGEYAKGGVIVPAGKERVRGMAHRWGPKGRRQ